MLCGFSVNQLIGFGAFQSGAAPTLSFEESAVDGANATVFTFSGMAIGSAAGDRVVFVAVSTGGSVTNSISSVKLGGNTMTQRVQAIAETDEKFVAIYSYPLTTGTTADVVITMSAEAAQASAATYASYGISSEIPHDTGTAQDSKDLSTTLNIPAGGFVIGIWRAGQYDGGGVTWDGAANKNFETNIEGNAFVSSASESGLSLETNRTVGVSYSDSSTNGEALAVGSWS